MNKQPKLINKLLITYRLSPESPISGRIFSITLTLQNIGDSVFSGGQLTRFSVRFKTNTTHVGRLPIIPSLQSGESKELEPRDFFALEDGAAWVEVSLKSNDEAEIHLFQTPEYDMGSSWGNILRITNAEYVEIIALLNRIVELLEKRSKKNA
jgi:hypothetical protein